MSSKRLNEHLRSRIARRAISHAFDAKGGELERQATDLAVKARDEILGDKAAMFAKCPAEWFRQEKSVRIDKHHLTLSDRVSLPTHLCYKFDYSGALLRKIAKCAEAQKDLSTERRRKEREITAVLSKFSTFSTLEKGWPEIWPFAKDMVPEPAPNLPPARLHGLNAELGLPPETAEAA